MKTSVSEFDELMVQLSCYVHLLVEIRGLKCRILESSPNGINKTAKKQYLGVVKK